MLTAIVLLKDKTPGTFVIRDSNSFPGAYGLALKVAQIPANVQSKPSGTLFSETLSFVLLNCLSQCLSSTLSLVSHKVLTCPREFIIALIAGHLIRLFTRFIIIAQMVGHLFDRQCSVFVIAWMVGHIIGTVTHFIIAWIV